MFRFEGLEVWKRSIKITDEIFDIAEGSGSNSKKEFKQYLNHSHRSIFETVNMLIIACRRKYIDEKIKDGLKNKLEEISKMISGFSRSLQPKTLRSSL
ncbi:MAG: four helix bundle protein [Bacteroidota bacterium]|nr:four helix bundle protein [Bacteroidota bacterium]